MTLIEVRKCDKHGVLTADRFRACHAIGRLCFSKFLVHFFGRSALPDFKVPQMRFVAIVSLQGIDGEGANRMTDHRRSSRRYFACIGNPARFLVGLVMTAAAVALVPSVATGALPKPVISDFSVSSASISSPVGAVTLAGRVSGATTCSISTNRAIPGLPVSLPCSTGTLNWGLVLPANTGRRPVTYRLRLTATGWRSVKSGTILITVAPGAGGLTNRARVVVGNASTESTFCSVNTDGTAECWGNNAYGQLGYGTTSPSTDPVKVVNTDLSGSLTGVTAIATFTHGFCALLANTGVACWGSNVDGALGDGHADDSAVPVSVSAANGTGPLQGVAKLIGAQDGMCALMIAGGVDCWGANTYGQLGAGTTTGPQQCNIYGTAPCTRWPVRVAGIGGSGLLAGVADLESNANGSFCAVLQSGSVDCWGGNTLGFLGDGTTTNRSAPTPVLDNTGSGPLTGVASMASDHFGYCAALASGGVDCWGWNYEGSLGNGQLYGPQTCATFICSTLPVPVVGEGGTGSLAGVASVVGDADHTYCALLTSGSVDCWGFSYNGQVGAGSTNSAPSPEAVLGIGGIGGLTGVTRLVGAPDSFCAFGASLGAACWGWNGNGQLGNGTTARSAQPVAVSGVGGAGLLGDVTSATSLQGSVCAIQATGGVVCWGANGYGQLGNGTLTDSPYPLAISA